MTYSPGIIEAISREIAHAPHGLKGETARRWAEALSISVAQVYRLASTPERIRRPRKAALPDVEAWAAMVAVWKKTPPKDAGEISTDQAIRLAVIGQALPEEALRVPIATYNRAIRRLGLNRQAKRRNRIQAAYPNKTHHFDASSSKFLYVARRHGDGDFVLRLHRPGAGGYKNKPVPEDRLRPWLYGLVDDYSGRSIARYVAAKGESMADSLNSLMAFWAVLGVPETLMCDNGMLKAGLPSADLIERLDVELPPTLPYAKEAHGKIERPWRTMWQRFELPLFAAEDWGKYEITMSELNLQLQRYLEEYNSMPHRMERGLTRMQAWERINWRGGVVALPEHALGTAARRARRKVDITGAIEYNGRVYEVLGLHDAWAWIWEGVYDGRLVAQSIETGERYEVRDYAPLDTGEFRAHPMSAHERAQAAAEGIGLRGGQTLYASRPEGSDGARSGLMAPSVAPHRIRETRSIEDPLDVARYPSIEEAMAAFVGYLGRYLPPDARGDIEAEIRANDLDRAYTRSLAIEMRGWMDREGRRLAAL